MINIEGLHFIMHYALMGYNVQPPMFVIEHFLFEAYGVVVLWSLFRSCLFCSSLKSVHECPCGMTNFIRCCIFYIVLGMLIHNCNSLGQIRLLVLIICIVL